MAWLGMDPNEEIHWVRSLSDARRRGEAAASQWSDLQLRHARQVARAAPWLKPGVLLGLGKGTASMEPVSMVAKLAALRSAQQNPTNRRPGSFVRGAEMTPGHRALFQRAQAQAGAQYVAQQQQRGAEAQATLGLKEEGILTDRGELRAPAPVGALQDYLNDPGTYAQRRPQEAARIGRFVDFVRGLAGEPRQIPRRGEVGEWQEIPFLTEGGKPGRFNPQSQMFFEPEPGVEGENVLDPAGILEYARRGSVGGVGIAESLEPITRPLAEGLEAELPQFRIPGAGPTPTELTQTAGIESPADALQQSMMALQALPQEAQGYIRNAYGELHGRNVDWWEPQSDLLISLQTGMDPGKGLLTADPDSEVAKERRRREEERGLIGGQRVTAGRWFASTVAEPGSQPYNYLSGLVDAGVAVVADPTVIAAGRLSNAAKARTIFEAGPEVRGASPLIKALKPGFIRQQREEAGLVEGLLTNNIHGPTKDGWLVGRHATKRIIEPLSEMTDPYEIYLFTNRKLDNRSIRGLVNADSSDQVRDVLRPHLGTTFLSTEDVWNDPFLLHRPAKGLKMVPHNIDPASPESWVKETENWVRGAIATSGHRGFTVDKASEFMGRMIMADTNNGRWNVLTDIMEDADGVLAQAGVESASLRKGFTKIFRDTVNDQGLWFIDELGNNKSVWHDIAAGDDVISGIDPFLLVEHIGRSIPLPNLSEFKELTARYPNLIKMAPDIDTVGGTYARFPKAFLDTVVNDVWKPFTLLRVAWPLRVIGEEQARMGMAGLHSMFSEHPISGISWALGRSESGRITRRAEQALTKVPGIKRRGGFTGLGTPFEEADEFEAAMTSSRRAGGFLNEKPGRVRTGQWKIYDQNEEEFADAWASELALLHHDPLARKVAQSDNLDEVHEWVTGTKEGRNWFDEMVDSHPVLAEPNALRRYLEFTAQHLETKTGGRVELLDAIRTGKHADEDWLVEGLRPTADFRRALRDDYIDAAPVAVKGPETAYMRDQSSIIRRGWDHAVDQAFAGLFSKPDSYLVASPVYRQYYWQHAEVIMRQGTKTAARTFVRNAKKADLPHGTVRRLEAIADNASGQLNAEEIHALAKGHALDSKKKLIYDLANKSQVGRQMEVLFPFIEAWREVITTWNRLLDPVFTTGDLAQRGRAVRNMRRAQQIITGLRGEGLGETLGVPEIWEPEEQRWRQPGFFWRDESTFNEEVFIMPGSQWLTGTLTDILPGVPKTPVPLTGRVQGLNMLGQVFPGVGPVAQIPVSYLLPDKPGASRWLRERFLPFGSIVDEGGATGWSAALNPLNYAPPWMKTGIQALINGGFDQQTNRMWVNAQMSAANYHYSTGAYDTTSPGGKQKLLEDSRDSARALYFIQSLVAFGAPTAPSKQFLTETNEGLIRLAMIRDDYYQLLGEDPTTADEKFLDRWGSLDAAPGKDKVGMAMQAFTREITGGLGVSKEWGDWAGSKEANYLKTQYPDIWAFFGPADEDAKFDYDTYLQQILSGKREQLTLDEWYDFGAQHIGRMHIDRADEYVAAHPDMDPDAADAFRADTETWVHENYPGYRTGGKIPGGEQRVTREDVMRQLADAMQNKRVQKTKMGRVLNEYWNERLRSVDYAASLGTLKVHGPWYDLSRSVDLANDRRFLYDLGNYYAQEDDGFKALWNRHLRNEVEPSEEELAAEEEAA